MNGESLLYSKVPNTHILRMRAELGGRRFEDVVVDIAFSDPLKWEPEKIVGSDLPEFAGIKAIKVPALPLE